MALRKFICAVCIRERPGISQCDCGCTHSPVTLPLAYGARSIVCINCCDHLYRGIGKCTICGGCTGGGRTCSCIDLCQRCFRRDGRTMCTCCVPVQPLQYYCATCCLIVREHRNCHPGTAAIQMRNPTLAFWVPTIKQFNWCEDLGENTTKYSAVSIEDAENVLTLQRAFQSTIPAAGLLDRKRFKHNSSRRFCAAELEILGLRDAANINAATRKWNCGVVRDGSIHIGDMDIRLRREFRPFEINTAPACGDALYDQIHEITNALALDNAYVNPSCGVHAHIDSRDFGYQDVQHLVVLYEILEPLLFEMIHPSRRNSDYCRVCGGYWKLRIVDGIKDKKDPKFKLGKASVIEATYGNGTAQAEVNGLIYDGKRGFNPPTYRRYVGERRVDTRYYALNIHSWFLRGTIEYRMHHGTVDGNDVFGWCRMLIDLHDRIKSFKSSNEVTTLLGALTKEAINIEAEKISKRTHPVRGVTIRAIATGIALAKEIFTSNTVDWIQQRVKDFSDHTNIAAKDNFGVTGISRNTA